MGWIRINVMWIEMKHTPIHQHGRDWRIRRPMCTMLTIPTIFAEKRKCPVVIGNVVVYLDKSHMTATFNETFGPIIRKDVMQILDNIPAKEKSMNNENLIDSGSLISGSWIGYNGEAVEDEEMRTNRSIPYDPDKS